MRVKVNIIYRNVPPRFNCLFIAAQIHAYFFNKLFVLQQLRVYESAGEVETFRFIEKEDFNEECVSLPIDKIVAGMIRERLK